MINKGRITITLAFLSILPILCSAQGNSNNRSTFSGGSGHFAVGYGYFPTQKLQGFLPDGAPELGNNHLTTGGGGYAMINDFIIGGSGFGITGETISTDSFEANSSGGAGFFNVGYRVAGRKNFNFYPLLGIGGGGLGLEINETDNLTTSAIAKDPGRSIKIDQSGWLLDLSLNLELYPISGSNDVGFGGLLTGIRVGYLYQPFGAEWEYEGGKVTNTPDFNLSGFYAQLTIGGGGFGISED